MKRIIAIALLGLAFACTSRAQSFQVNYSWQYPEAPAQQNCAALNFCNITFPAQNGLPYARVTPYYGSGGLRLAYTDGDGNSGHAAVQPPQCGSDNCTFSIVNMTIYDKNGSVVGTMNETYAYTVTFHGGRGCGQACISPQSASLQ